jgi:hypothetical protein
MFRRRSTMCSDCVVGIPAIAAKRTGSDLQSPHAVCRWSKETKSAGCMKTVLQDITRSEPIQRSPSSRCLSDSARVVGWVLASTVRLTNCPRGNALADYFDRFSVPLLAQPNPIRRQSGHFRLAVQSGHCEAEQRRAGAIDRGAKLGAGAVGSMCARVTRTGGSIPVSAKV